MQINIPLLQVRKSRSDCVHEQVAKRIANVRFTRKVNNENKDCFKSNACETGYDGRRTDLYEK